MSALLTTASSKKAAELSLSGFEDATAQYGSILQCLIQGHAVQAHAHYPSDDVIDHESGSQYFYHSHRAEDNEHGHLHLFWHADARGRRTHRKHVQSSSNWSPSHLLAIGLASNGLPTSLFTTNQWVTGGYWFDAAKTLKMLSRFSLGETGPYAPVNRFINGLLALYKDEIQQLLSARDNEITTLLKKHPWQSLQEKEQAETLSLVALDWVGDLEKL